MNRRCEAIGRPTVLKMQWPCEFESRHRYKTKTKIELKLQGNKCMNKFILTVATFSLGVYWSHIGFSLITIEYWIMTFLYGVILWTFSKEWRS